MGICPCIGDKSSEENRDKQSSIASYQSEQNGPQNLQQYPKNIQFNTGGFFHYLEQYQQIKQTLSKLLTQTPQNMWHKHEQMLYTYRETLEKYQIKIKKNQQNQVLLKSKQFYVEFQQVSIDDNLYGQQRYFSPYIQLFIINKNQKKNTSYKTIRPVFDKKNLNVATKNHQINENMQFPLKDLEQSSEKSMDKSFYYGTEKQSFQIQLIMYDKVKQKDVQIGTHQTFSLSEFKDQDVHDIQVSLKNSQNLEIYGYVKLKCQLIYNYQQFYEYWEQELNVRLRQIMKILSKLDENPELRVDRISQRNDNNSQFKYSAKTMDIIESLASQNNSQGDTSIKGLQEDNDSFYDGGFYVK